MYRLLLTLLIVSLLALNAISQNIPQNGLQAEYDFNGDVLDLSGNGNDGSNLGGIFVNDRFGNPSGALQLNGINEYVQFPNDFDYPSRTIVQWLNVNSISTSGAELLYNSSYPGLQNSRTNIQVVKINGADYFNITVGANNSFNFPVFLNEWFMLTTTIGPNSVSVYVNGRFITSFNYNPNTSVDGQAGSRFGASRLLDGFFHGSVDQILIYDRELDVCEIAQIYNLKLDEGLIGQWDFNGNALDVSGNNINGLVSGAQPTQDRFGNANSAYYLDGIDDRITWANDFDVPNKTITYWFKADVINPLLGALWNTDHLGSQWGITANVVYENAGVNLLRYNTGGNQGIFDIEINEGQWYMSTIIVYREVLYYYLNDQFLGQFVNGFGHSVNGFSGTQIGCTRLTDRFFEGSVDDIKIYNRILSECEIKKLYDESQFERQDISIASCERETVRMGTELQNANWFQNGNLIGSGDSLISNNIKEGIVTAIGGDPCGCQAIDTFRIRHITATRNFRFDKCKEGSYLIQVDTTYDSLVWRIDGNIVSRDSSSYLVTDTSNVTVVLRGLDSNGCRFINDYNIISLQSGLQLNEYDSVLCSSDQLYTYEVFGSVLNDYFWSIEGGEIVEDFGTTVRVRWGNSGIAKLSVYEVNVQGCISDTNEIDFYLDSIGSKINVVSYSEDFDSISIDYSLYARDNQGRSVFLDSVIIDDFDTEFIRNTIEFDSSERVFNIDSISISILDTCGKSVLSNYHNLINVELSQESGVDEISIVWNDYKAWANDPVEYDLFELQPEANSRIKLNTFSNQLNEIIDTDKGQVLRCFYIEARNLDNGLISRSNLECLEYKPDIFIPNMISPNEDGKNDLFRITGLEDYPDNQLIIYNRYGQKVFDKAPYDNSWRGEDLSSGVYFYHLLLFDRNVNYKGFIHILR